MIISMNLHIYQQGSLFQLFHCVPKCASQGPQAGAMLVRIGLKVFATCLQQVQEMDTAALSLQALQIDKHEIV